MLAFNGIWSRHGGLNEHCSRFCDGQILTSLQLSTPQDFELLNLKGFREEHREEHLVPNQIPTLIERCRDLLKLEAFKAQNRLHFAQLGAYV